MAEESTATPVREAITEYEAADRLKSLLGDDATGAEEVDTAETESQEEVEATEETEQDAEAESEETEEAAEEGAETETEEDASPQPKRWKVKAAGDEIEVTEDELIRGYQRDADYRKKTAEVAEIKRATEAERQRYEQSLQQFIPILQAQIQDKFAGVDWVALARENPSEYVAQKAEYDRFIGNLNMAMAEQQRIESQRKEEAQKEHQERLTAEYERLIQRHPEFADPVKGKEVRSELRSFLKEAGYSDEEIGGLADSRAASIAYDALRFRKAQKAKSESAEKVKALPKVQKPGASKKVDPTSERLKQAKRRIRENGRNEDIAAALEIAGIG